MQHGNRHPHAWSIVDEQELVKWIWSPFQRHEDRARRAASAQSAKTAHLLILVVRPEVLSEQDDLGNPSSRLNTCGARSACRLKLNQFKTRRDGEVRMVARVDAQLLQSLEAARESNNALAKAIDRQLLHRIDVDGLFVLEVGDAIIVQVELALSHGAAFDALTQIALCTPPEGRRGKA